MPRSWMLWFGLLLHVSAAVHAQSPVEWRSATSAEQALDAAALNSMDQAITGHLTDVNSAVVVPGGRVVYEFYREGSSAALRDVQSVAKTQAVTISRPPALWLAALLRDWDFSRS